VTTPIDPEALADGVFAAEMTESAFGNDGMLTGRAGPCHAVPKRHGDADYEPKRAVLPGPAAVRHFNSDLLIAEAIKLADPATT
jgi:hypothetical protein